MASEVAKLYVTLGVNSDDLKVGFEKADKTVGQYISQLNNEAKMIKLKANLELGGLGENASALDKLKIKAKELQELMANAQRKVNLSQQSVGALTERFGAGNQKTQREQINLLYRQSDLQKLQNELKAVNAQISQINGHEVKLSGVQQAKRHVENLKGSLDKCTKTLLNISNAMNVVSGMASGLGGLTDFVKGAVQKGENLYQMMGKLHESAADTGALMKMATMSGTDSNQIFNFLAKLDNTMKSYDEESESVKKKMEAYGINLKNDNGALKSTTEQLQELADAYKRAKIAGEAKDFQVNILGRFGQGLETLIDEYDDFKQAAKGVTGAGLLDPDAAHKTYIEMQQLNAQAGQMKDVLATAMIPVVKEIMPEMTRLLGEAAGFIKGNKEAIKGFGEAGVSAISGIVSAAEGLVKVLGEVNNALPALGGTDEEVSQLKAHYGKDWSTKQGVVGAAGAIGGAIIGSAAGPIGTAAGAATGATLAVKADEKLNSLMTSDLDMIKAEMDTFAGIIKEFNAQQSGWINKKTEGQAVEDFRGAEYDDDKMAAVAEKYSMTLDEFKTSLIDNMQKMGMSADQMAAAGEKWNISADDIADYVMQKRVSEAQLSDEQYQLLYNQQMSAAQYVGILDELSSNNVKNQGDIEKILSEFHMTPEQFKELIDQMWSDSKEINDKAKEVWAKIDGAASATNKAADALNKKLQGQIDQLTLSPVELATKQANQQKEQNIKNGADPALANKLAGLQIDKALQAEQEKRVNEAKAFGSKLKSAHDAEISARDKIKSATEGLASAVEGAKNAHKRVKDLQQELYQLQTYGKVLEKDPVAQKQEELAEAKKAAQAADKRVQEAREALAQAKAHYNRTNNNFQALLRAMDNNTRAILGQEQLAEITQPVEPVDNGSVGAEPDRRQLAMQDAMANGIEVYKGAEKGYGNNGAWYSADDIRNSVSQGVAQGMEQSPIPQDTIELYKGAEKGYGGNGQYFPAEEMSQAIGNGMQQALQGADIGTAVSQAVQAYAQASGANQQQQAINIDAKTTVDMSGSVNSNDVVDKAKEEAEAIMKEKTQQLTQVIRQANNSLNYSF